MIIAIRVISEDNYITGFLIAAQGKGYYLSTRLNYVGYASELRGAPVHLREQDKHRVQSPGIKGELKLLHSVRNAFLVPDGIGERERQ